MAEYLVEERHIPENIPLLYHLKKNLAVTGKIHQSNFKQYRVYQKGFHGSSFWDTQLCDTVSLIQVYHLCLFRYIHFCGGSAVSDLHIVTSVQCVTVS